VSSKRAGDTTIEFRVYTNVSRSPPRRLEKSDRAWVRSAIPLTSSSVVDESGNATVTRPPIPMCSARASSALTTAPVGVSRPLVIVIVESRPA